MIPEKRRQKILELIQEEGSARVKKLSAVFSVTEQTIRQDLEKMETAGSIVRRHGGAYLKNVPSQVANLTLQRRENLDKKRVIGKKAAEFIENGDSIILDAGSTTTEIAAHLLDRKNLNIITNALNIALVLGAKQSFSILMPGGEFKPPTLSLTGEKAAVFFHNLYASKLFLATFGVSFETGLTYPGFSDLHVKKALIQSASEVYLVADSTKIGRTSFASLGGLDMLDCFITDKGIRDKDKARFEDLGVKVVIA